MYTFEMPSVDEELVEEENATERAKTVHILEGEVNKLKAADLMVDKKLEHMRLCFEELLSKLKS